MENIHVEETVVSGAGPRTLYIPAGAFHVKVAASGGGTIKLKRGKAAVVALAPETSYETPSGPSGSTYPEMWVEFSGGAGMARYHSAQPLGGIHAYAAEVAIATAVTTVRT